MIMQCKIEHMPIGAKLLAFEVEGVMVKDVQIKPNYIEVHGDTITLMYRSGTGRRVASEVGIKAGTLVQYEIEGSDSHCFKVDAKAINALNSDGSLNVAIERVLRECAKSSSFISCE